MDAWLIAGRFLVLGLVAGVAAIVLGVGVFFDMWRWRDRWPLFGALSGLAAFGVWVYGHALDMAMLAANSGSLVGWGALVSVGCGIALSYGSLFPPRHLARPATLPPGSAEERLWLLDAADRLLPQSLDWVLTGVLLLPGLAMIHLGLTQIFLPGPLLFGAAAVTAPLYAAMGLGLRRRAAREFLRELDATASSPGDLLPNTGPVESAAVGDQGTSGAPAASDVGAPGFG